MTRPNLEARERVIAAALWLAAVRQEQSTRHEGPWDAAEQEHASDRLDEALRVLARSNFDDVGDFHDRFGLDRARWPQIGPRAMDRELFEFRKRFMQEELDEFCTAYEEGDDAKMFDGLLDLAYVVFGTAHFLGYPWEEGWDLVQEANMTKVRAESAEESGAKTGRHHFFDVVKPDGFVPPDIAGLLSSYGWPGD